MATTTSTASGTGLVGAVHEALNATAVRRRPDASSLPPPASGPSGPSGRPVPLPVPPPPRGVLAEVLGRRRSSYSFGGEPSPVELASVLHHGIGGAPRAGGLRSLVPYVVTRRGVHLADLRLPCPCLVPVRAGDPTAYVAGSLDQPEFASRVPVWLALVADLEACRGRYPPRHYRTLHVDAGLAVQGALLTATALDLTVCPVMGYDDEAWARLLDLPPSSLVTVLVALGGPV